jgi:hypothetical protein
MFGLHTFGLLQIHLLHLKAGTSGWTDLQTYQRKKGEKRYDLRETPFGVIRNEGRGGLNLNGLLWEINGILNHKTGYGKMTQTVLYWIRNHKSNQSMCAVD